jgi:Ca-activated chloride channel homolog
MSGDEQNPSGCRRGAASCRLLAAVMAVGVLAPSLVGQERPQFASKVEAVRVDVLVTDAGKPVSGLGLSDFEVYDNGVRQKISLAGAERMPVNVTLALDASNSVTGARLRELRAATHALLAGLEAQDQAALVTFSHRVSLASPLTHDVDCVRAAIDELRTGGGTALFDAVFAGLVLNESEAARGLLVVFTDGADTSSLLTREAVADVAKRSDSVAYAAVAGLLGRRSSLSEVVEQTGGRVLDLHATSDLPSVFEGILQEFRQRYLLSYAPAGVPAGGWHRLDVRVKGKPYTVKARLGYRVEL